MRGRVLSALTSLVLLVVATAAALVVAELASRALVGWPLAARRLPPGAPPPSAGRLVDLTRRLPLTDGVDPAWIDDFPPPLANRKPVDPELLAIRTAAAGRLELESELYRQWNARFVETWGCPPGSVLQLLPPPLFVFEPPEPSSQPVYRFLLDVTTPLGLVTNRFGWRGPEIPLDKPSGTVRVAFVGASTTVGQHDFPFSYPEFVVHWLNAWAERTGQAVRFDGINAGREGIASSAIAAIVRQEVVPAEPDLVVYYEGANQFSLANLIDIAVPPPPKLPPFPPGLWNDVATPLRPYSALVRRIDRWRRIRSIGDGAEPPKPPYRLTWPAGVDEETPDIGRRNLPLDLSTTVADLESMRAALDGIGAELAVSSFVWMVADGMRLDPARDAMLYVTLNERWWPYRYADIRRLADFQNRVLARYAAAHGLSFVDVAAAVPRDPSLFLDPVHFTYDGVRVQAWAVLNAILPHVRERLAAGAWPRPDRHHDLRHPGIVPPERVDACAAWAARQPAQR